MNLKDSGAVCEDAIVKEEAIDKFRTKFRQKMVEKTEIPRNERRKFVREKLKECEYIDEDPEDEEEEEDHDNITGSGSGRKHSNTSAGYYITYDEFRNFLLKFHIYMSERSFSTLCLALDKTQKNQHRNVEHGSETDSHHEHDDVDDDFELDTEGSISILFIYHKIFPEVAIRQERKLAEKKQSDKDTTDLKNIRIRSNSEDGEHLIFKRKPSQTRLRGTDADTLSDFKRENSPTGSIGIGGSGGSSTNLHGHSTKDKDKPKRIPAWKRMFGHKQSFSNEVEVVVDGNAFGVSSTISGVSVQDRMRLVTTDTSGTQLEGIGIQSQSQSQPLGDIENNIELRSATTTIGTGTGSGNSKNKRFSVQIPSTFTVSMNEHATNIGKRQLVKQISSNNVNNA